jgi:hypothetical protein
MIRLMVACLLVGGTTTGALAQSNDLVIDPVEQRSPYWCWLAVGEMVFEHYGVPDVNPAGIFQCGIVGVIALHGLADRRCNRECRYCPEPAGTASRLTQMLELYPRVLRGDGYFDGTVDATHRRSPLSRSSVVNEIDIGNPVIAGITPGRNLGAFRGGAAHVALIVGYYDDGDTLIVNDPYPYQTVGWDPYRAAGARQTRYLQYEIDYDDFRRNLNWTESWLVEASRDDGDLDDDDGLATYCCTNIGRLGPYPPGIGEGQACYGTHPVFGQAFGRACY